MPRIKERFARMTAQNIVTTLDWAGIATIASGTTVASVAATRATSGAIIFTQALQYPNVTTVDSNAAPRIETCAISVANGSFLITTTGSMAPTAPMPVGWVIFRQSK